MSNDANQPLFPKIADCSYVSCYWWVVSPCSSPMGLAPFVLKRVKITWNMHSFARMFDTLHNYIRIIYVMRWTWMQSQHIERDRQSFTGATSFHKFSIFFFAHASNVFRRDRRFYPKKEFIYLMSIVWQRVRTIKQLLLTQTMVKLWIAECLQKVGIFSNLLKVCSRTHAK